MSPTTRYQAVRAALMELGPTTNIADIAAYVKKQFGMEFENDKTVALYVAMVKSKMSRKPTAGNNVPSGAFSFDRP